MRHHWMMVSLMTLMIVTSVAAQAGWEEGVTAFTKGDWDTAEQEFKALVAAQPDAFQGHFMLGRTYLKKNQTQQALAHMRKAYDLNPNDISIELALGQAYVAAGRYADAVHLLSRINAASLPNRAQGLHAKLKGIALSKTGQYEAAVTQLNRAKSMTGKPEDLKEIWRELGFAYEKQKKYTESIEAYQNAGDQADVDRVMESQTRESEN